MDIINDEYVYKINVSGKIYEIKHKILKKIPYFLEYINEIINNDESKCFVERSSMIFDHVLAYVIDPLHPYPSKYFYELDFYGLIYTKNIYKVNVLGKIYHLKYEILMKIPYFVAIINSISNSSVEIFVDRSPLLFNQVLVYVMDDNSPIDCYDELKYYGIKYNKYRLSHSDLHIAKDSIEHEISKLSDKLNNIEEDITKIHTKLDDNDDNATKKTCKYEYCENYVKGKNDNYCYDHGECAHCYKDATRNFSNEFLCSKHQNY